MNNPFNVEDVTDKGFEYESKIDSEDLSGYGEEDIKLMMEKSINMISNGREKVIYSFKCKICGKDGMGSVIKRHIRANHLGKNLQPMWTEVFVKW